MLNNRMNKVHQSTLILCSLIFMLLLAACGDNATAQKAAVTPTPTVVVSPTPVQSPTPDPASKWKVYNGAKFTIKYPADWAMQESNKTASSDQLELHNDRGLFLIQALKNTGNSVSESMYSDIMSTVLKKSLMQNAHDEPAPPTLTVGKTTWSQQSFTGDMDQSGQKLHAKLILLIHNDAVNETMYGVFIGADQTQFSDMNDQYFNAMLQSFSTK